VRLLVRTLGAEVARDSAIVIEADPLCLLVLPTANRDVEVRYFPIVEDVACGWLVECGLVMEDALLQGVEAIFIPLCGHSGVGFLVSDGLEEAIGDTSEEDSIQVWLHL
jgi:hypothetical protein